MIHICFQMVCVKTPPVICYLDDDLFIHFFHLNSDMGCFGMFDDVDEQFLNGLKKHVPYIFTHWFVQVIICQMTDQPIFLCSSKQGLISVQIIPYTDIPAVILPHDLFDKMLPFVFLVIISKRPVNHMNHLPGPEFPLIFINR
jgi:hypothetical protein